MLQGWRPASRGHTRAWVRRRHDNTREWLRHRKVKWAAAIADRKRKRAASEKALAQSKRRGGLPLQTGATWYRWAACGGNLQAGLTGTRRRELQTEVTMPSTFTRWSLQVRLQPQLRSSETHQRRRPNTGSFCRLRRRRHRACSRLVAGSAAHGKFV